MNDRMDSQHKYIELGMHVAYYDIFYGCVLPAKVEGFTPTKVILSIENGHGTISRRDTRADRLLIIK